MTAADRVRNATGRWETITVGQHRPTRRGKVHRTRPSAGDLLTRCGRVLSSDDAQAASEPVTCRKYLRWDGYRSVGPTRWNGVTR